MTKDELPASDPSSANTDDAGKILDAVTQLRRLMTALDSASYTLEILNDEDLRRRLSEDATDVLRVLELLERSPPYKQIRKEYYDPNSEA